LWRDVGARLLRTTPEAHDEFVSRSSHLPHLLAATLANLVLDPKLPKDQAVLCATGFRDTTRIASGSPEMWRDIALTNRKYLGRTLARFVADLGKFQAALKRGDARAIAKYFETAKLRRDNWCACGASPSPE
jgi:prephenate dehydrogenase